MRTINANKADKVVLRHLIADPHKPKQIADDSGFARPYVAERIKRMVEHGWVDRKANGLYSISPIGRRKYAELDDTTVDTIEEFVQIYGPSAVIHLITHIDVRVSEDTTPHGEKYVVVEPDTPFTELSDDLDIRTDHLEVALEILVAAIRDDDDGGAGDSIGEWIASSEDLYNPYGRNSGSGSGSGNDNDGLEQTAD